MNKRFGIRIVIVLALLAMPFMLAAQEKAAKHTPSYTFVDLGTLGGPTSNAMSFTVPINNTGTVVGVADTTLLDPICGLPAAIHAFKWGGGVLTDLGTLPGGFSSLAVSINSKGVVAGFSANGLIDPATDFCTYETTIWKKSGKIVALGTLGGSFSLPNFINDRGQVVGYATNTIPDPDNFGAILVDLPSSTQWRAALWENGTIRDLGTLGDGPVSRADFVNNRGQVAGASLTNSVPNPTTGMPTVAPFLWENGRMRNLGSLGGVYGFASWLNNKGQVAGTSNLAGDQASHAFLWYHGKMKDLGTLGGIWSEANQVNDKGDVVGESVIANGGLPYPYHGFIWRDGAMTELPILAGNISANTFDHAISINMADQVVGYSCDGSFTVCRGILWEDGGPAIDLNIFLPPGSDFQITEAQFITDRGEIVGRIDFPNGDYHAFVLIPKKENDPADMAGAASATSNDVAAAVQSLTNATNTRLAPHKLDPLREWLLKGHRGLGTRPPN